MPPVPKTPPPSPQEPQEATSPTPSPETPPAPPEPTTAAPTGSGARSSGGSRFQVDPGPAFDAENRPAGPPPESVLEPEPELAALEDVWDERRVRQLLVAKGAALHHLVAVDKQSTEWAYLPGDLDAVAPPLTAILNRYEPTRAAAHMGDEIALLVGLAGYTTRSVMERRHAIGQLQDAGPQPITGVAADGPAPEEDAEQRRAAGYVDDEDLLPPPDLPGPRRR